MPFRPSMTTLRDVLVDIYPTDDDIRILLEAVGVPTRRIKFTSVALNTWYFALSEADNQGMIGDIVKQARQDNPKNPYLSQADDNGVIPGVGGVEFSPASWQGPAADNTLQYEVLTSRLTTFLPVEFMETGLRRVRAVVRIKHPEGKHGTGFLTDDNLLITNNHVIPSREVAAIVKAEFHYDTQDMAPQQYDLDAAGGFATSPKEQDDWTAVRIKGDPQKDSQDQYPIQPIKLVRLPAGEPAVPGPAFIIQHPAGGPKQLALYNNMLVHADERRIQYKTDTLEGSSGSPVFDVQWRVIGLHHSGGWLPKNPNTMKAEYANEGIHINVVLDGLKNAGLITA